MRIIRVLGILLILPIAMASSCTTGMDSMQPTVPDTTPVTGPISFSNHVLPIFAANCVACHQSGGFPNLFGISMILTPEMAYGSLVNQASSEDGSLTRVIPGNSAQSLLYLKVSSDSPPFGSRMPLFRSPLSSRDIGVIKDWIDQGALNN